MCLVYSFVYLFVDKSNDTTKQDAFTPTKAFKTVTHIPKEKSANQQNYKPHS
jgi:hypothetical protein